MSEKTEQFFRLFRIAPFCFQSLNTSALFLDNLSGPAKALIKVICWLGYRRGRAAGRGFCSTAPRALKHFGKRQLQNRRASAVPDDKAVEAGISPLGKSFSPHVDRSLESFQIGRISVRHCQPLGVGVELLAIKIVEEELRDGGLPCVHKCSMEPRRPLFVYTGNIPGPNLVSFSRGNRVLLRQQKRQALQSLAVRCRTVHSRHDIISEKDRAEKVHVITAGFAYRYKQLQTGGRQIMGFLIPGDVCDLHAWLVGNMDHGVSALGECELAVIPHQRLSDLVKQCPDLALTLWRDTMLDGAISREWIVNLGRRPAFARVSHLLCEVWYRLHELGLARDHSYDFPVTQGELADALGLSIVHVNRTLQQLRAKGLIGPQSSRIIILDWPRLQEAAEFDPTYLRVANLGGRFAQIGPQHMEPQPVRSSPSARQ